MALRCQLYPAEPPSQRVASEAGRWASILDRPAVVGVLVLLVGVRFVASTLTAFAGIEGIDTRGLDAGFEVFSYLLLAVLFIVAAVALSDVRATAWSSPRLVLFLGLTSVTLVLWLGVMNPNLRVLTGGLAAWQDFALGTAASLALGVITWHLADRLPASERPNLPRDGLRAVGGGFALALLLRSIRLLDFGYVFSWTPPSGLLWILDFGPSLILTGLALLFWSRLVVTRSETGKDWARALLPPGILALAAEGAAVGALGGFIASNALAWGGSYTVFPPTVVSLPIVGLGVGAYLSTAGVVGVRTPRASAWLLFGGIAIAALAGIQTSAGTLASFAGLLAGVACVGRGLAKFGGEGS